jgi:FtsP/CotA-like multicopper oxidase with cupredoxin domain
MAQPFRGKRVFHCHILEHEDHGMMGTLEVV